MDISLTPYNSKDHAETWMEIQNNAQSTFLTSLDWIRFQKEQGKDLRKYIIKNRSDTIGLLFFEVSKRKIVSYLYAPYNPVVDWQKLGGKNNKNIKILFTYLYFELHKLQKKFQVQTFRLDPLLSGDSKELVKNIGYKKSLAPAQAIDMWEIDLTLSEEKIRSGMSKSTRYNINKGMRSDLEFIRVDSLEDVKKFGKLMDETTQRKGFSNFSTDYFVSQFSSLHAKGKCDLFVAKLQEEVLAGIWLNYHKDTAYYTHGASTSNKSYSKLRAPYPLQWFVMQSCKKNGYKKYNMWGILPERVDKHAQTGVSNFKKSFGGYEINLVGPHEIGSLYPKYQLQRIIEWWLFRKDRY